MKDLTQGELQTIKDIAQSDFRSDGDLTCPVWVDAQTPKKKGFLSSCVKKGLVSVDNTTKGEETCWLTNEGISIYNSNK